LRSPGQIISIIRKRLSDALPGEFLRSGSWGMVDQAIVSGTNFLVTIIAARMLGPTDFGVFALLITVLTFMEATQRSLITTPHNVLGASRNGDEYARYTTSLIVVQAGLGLTFAIVSATAGLIFLQYDRSIALLIFAMSYSALAWQFHEFFRRALFTESRVRAAVVGDSVSYLGRLIMVAGIATSGLMSGASLMLIYAISWSIGALAGFWMIRGSIVRSVDLSLIREHWVFGRWLFASNSVSHLPGYVIAALLSSVLSVSAYGAFRTFEQLANGTNVPLSAMSNVLRPRLARQAKDGPERVWNTMLPIMLLGGLLLVAFAAVFIALREPLVRVIYGPEYVAFTAAVFLIAFRPLLTLEKSMLTKALQAFRNTRAVFIGTLIGVVAGVGIGSLLIIFFGLPAAASIVIVSSVVTIAFFAIAWQRIRANESWWTNKVNSSASIQQD
jgi:O-antigen/teichoic acid export membrane protein